MHSRLMNVSTAVLVRHSARLERNAHSMGQKWKRNNKAL